MTTLPGILDPQQHEYRITATFKTIRGEVPKNRLRELTLKVDTLIRDFVPDVASSESEFDEIESFEPVRSSGQSRNVGRRVQSNLLGRALNRVSLWRRLRR